MPLILKYNFWRLVTCSGDQKWKLGGSWSQDFFLKVKHCTWAIVYQFISGDGLHIWRWDFYRYHMKQDGLLLGWLCHGCMLHCAANFSRVWLLTILWNWCLSGRLLSSFTGLIPSVGLSSVPPWGVVKKSVVLFCHSHMDITFGIHTCLYVWCPGLQTGHNLWCFTISQRLWRSLFCNAGMKPWPVCVILSSTNSSARSLGAYSVYHLFQVFQCLLRWNQLQRMKSALDLKGHLFHLVVSFCLLLSRWLSSQQHLQILGHS